MENKEVTTEEGESDKIHITGIRLVGYIIGSLTFMAGFWAIEYSNGGRGSVGGIFLVLAGLAVLPAFWNILDDELDIRISPGAAAVLFIVFYTIGAFLWNLPIT